MIHPTLFKKSSTGASQFWEISAVENDIITRWGQVGGAVQETRDRISQGKNIGRSNETSTAQQAALEAEAQWTKKLKRGYVQTLEAAVAGEVDEVITGGISPMLAFSYDKQGHKIRYPVYGNPKLDGTRCIAMVADGKCTLWTRTRKPITAMPHIIKALEAAYPSGTVSFDGELYAAHLNNDFEQIIHLVRSSSAAEGHEAIQYWIYDVPEHGTFEERYARLSVAFPVSPHLVLVEATLLGDETEAMEYFGACEQQGFEGAILRNKSGPYVGKRSADLIKLKSFLDGEFRITGVEEGRGKLAKHAGAFVCVTASGGEFRAKLKGSLDSLRTHFENQGKCIGKMLTVRYQNLTSDGIPRFPVGVAIRDYE